MVTGIVALFSSCACTHPIVQNNITKDTSLAMSSFFANIQSYRTSKVVSDGFYHGKYTTRKNQMGRTKWGTAFSRGRTALFHPILWVAGRIIFQSSASSPLIFGDLTRHRTSHRPYPRRHSCNFYIHLFSFGQECPLRR